MKQSFIQIGSSWIKTEEIAAIVREGQDEARIYLTGSSFGHKVPITPQKVLDLIAGAVSR